MIRRKFLLVAAALVGSIVGMPTVANAAFALRYSTNGGATYTTVTDVDNDGFISVKVGSLTIQATASGSTEPGMTTIDLGVSGSTSGALNLVVQASMTDLVTAPPPQTLTYDFTGSTSASAGTVTHTQATFINSSNTLFNTSGNLAATGSLATGSSGSDTFSGTVPYSITVEMRLKATGTTVKVGSRTVQVPYTISSDNNDSITAAAPAPSGLMVALSSVPFLGFAGWVRRRRDSAIVV